jgi:putative inorganic carbon (hco3(-)) transporter
LNSVSRQPSPRPWSNRERAPAGGAISAKPPAAAFTDPFWDAEQASPTRRLGFILALFFIFLRLSFLHEIIFAKTGVNTYLLLLFRIPVMTMMIISGGLGRGLKGRTALYWLALTAWMIIDLPFSTWRSDSILSVYAFITLSLTMVPVISGMASTVKDCIRMLWVFALAGCVNILSSRLFANAGENDRLFSIGSISNANDFAGHLLYVLPFVFFGVLQTRSNVVKLVLSGMLIYGLYAGAQTASRGGLIALVALVLYLLFRGPGKMRLAAVAVILTALIVGAMLPDFVIKRYRTIITTDEKDLPEEAIASAHTRGYLFWKSVHITLAHPLFGIGPAQFPNVEGNEARALGKHGSWQVTHNTYTQISSECGIPALFFLLLATGSTWRLLVSVQKLCWRRGRFHAIANMAFCLQLSWVGFSVAVIFLSMGYSMYLPTLTGIAIALDRCVRREIARDEGSTAPGLPPQMFHAPAIRA